MRDMEEEDSVERCRCGGEYVFNSFCGADVCEVCGDHKGLSQCFCGWRSGGSDYAPGEPLEDDVEFGY